MALLQNIAFTDPQGVDHISAVFGVSYAASYENSNTSLNRDMVDMTTMNETITNNVNVNVQFYYWADDAKRLAGNSPYILANMGDGTQPPTMTFDFVATDVAYDGLSLEDQCYYYLQNTVLA